MAPSKHRRLQAAVLGGAGFIGSHIVDALVARGHHVTVFDRAPERFRAPLDNVDYIYGDFSDLTALAAVLRGKDAVFHLVSTTFPGTANRDPRADVSSNLLGTLALIEEMQRQDIKRLIYLSSGGTVYGPLPDHPVAETHPLRPINSYGIVKATVEHYLSMYHALGALDPLAIRAANPFGPRQSHTGVQGVVATFMRQLIDGQSIEIWGDGHVIRDYLYISDLADLCVTAAESDLCGALNAGSGQGTSLLQLIAALAEITDQEILPTFKPTRSVDVPYSVLDVEKAKSVLNWTPATSLKEGLGKTWAWMNTLSP